MQLQTVDWGVVALFLLINLAIGIALSRRAGRSVDEYFLAGRGMPWWLLGISMVATTFSADTPNLVTDIVRRDGVAGNWVWWALLLTGMLTTFVYARLWSRSGIDTDVGFYELRYSGRLASFLRGFRAVYLGAFFNIMIMASVTLAAIKISGVLLGLDPWTTVLVAGSVTVVYSMLGGLTGILITDLILFATAMIGSLAAAYHALAHPEVGGLSGLLEHGAVASRTALLPDLGQPELFVPLLVIPLAVQWWSVWYPGSEPGGGGYVAQRMLAARSERHAQGASLLFNAAHYALRPWPWILVALASLIVYPDLEALRRAFPGVESAVVSHDLAYAAMLTFLPTGLLGLVVASLVAAFMSTLSTHLNWGASYLVHDLYRRFWRPQASDRELVRAGRITTVLLMMGAGLVALALSNALQAFQILLQIGAGTGLLFMLRWFWWRINAVSELAAMVVSFCLAVYFELFGGTLFGLATLPWQRLVCGVVLTTIAWVGATLLTPPTAETTLRSFYRHLRPAGPGWDAVKRRARAEGKPLPQSADHLALGLLCMLLGTLAIYSALFTTGLLIYGRVGAAIALGSLGLGCGLVLKRTWSRL